MTDRLTRIGEMAHGTVRHEDVCWLIDEVERLRGLKVLFSARPNLKGVLMELGNRLVTEHGWEPASGSLWERIPSGDHTGLIAGLTQQINDSPEMRELLGALGFDWPIVEEDE
jgi:hypothetical protein